MQGLADGYFVIPYTISDYFAREGYKNIPNDRPEFKAAEKDAEDRIHKLLSVNGNKTVDEFHRELGKILWDDCGMARNKAGLQDALKKIPKLREEFWKNVKVPGSGAELNQSLERAGRVADFLEFGELMCLDALTREESCGGHFREEHQTPDGEAKRDDENFCHVTAWEFQGENKTPKEHREQLVYEEIKLAVRSYK
jgi:succinate dehydrogenase / fumarate reductase flavoprotein subunit